MKLDFEGLLDLLHAAGTRFIVAGGVACALNGFVRATEDIDILVDAAEDNVRRLLDTLSQWGEGHAREFTLDDFSLEPGAIRLIEDFPLDIFVVLAGKTYEDFLASARTASNGFLYLSPGDLIETKKRTHREKDQIDILALQRIIKQEMDADKA